MSIASSIVTTLKSFNVFIDQIKAPGNAQVEGLSISGWEDELGRLRIWAANIGAHQTNRSSLDYRLRDASHVRNQIVELLGSIVRRLDDAREVFSEIAGGLDKAISDDEFDDVDLEPEMKQMQSSVATIIGCLFQMSMLVRKPANLDLRIGSRWSDVAWFEHHDIDHVKEKYPKASETLVSRLGNALTRRRMYLKYRERHADKLKQGLDHAEGHDDATVLGGTASILSDTIATSLRDQHVLYDDQTSEAGASQTSDATSLISGAQVAIPFRPKASRNGQPFECPVCRHIIKIDGPRSWQRHVFRDLQPYVCINVECMTPQKLYSTKHEWQHHFRIRHHGIMSTDVTTQSINVICPLCEDECDTEGHLSSHIARHLKDLALFVLPQGDEDPEDSCSSVMSDGLSSDSAVGGEDPEEENLARGERKLSQRESTDENRTDEALLEEKSSVQKYLEIANQTRAKRQKQIADQANLFPPIGLAEDHDSDDAYANSTPPQVAREKKEEGTDRADLSPSTDLAGNYDSDDYYDLANSTPPLVARKVELQLSSEQSSNSVKPSTRWFCGHCRDGPHNSTIELVCIACGKEKDVHAVNV